MALGLSRERYGSKKPANETYVSGAEIMARAKAAEPVRTFRSDVDKFYRSVDMDTTGENRFNAADYFEERMKQADALRLRATNLSRYMENNKDSLNPESYESMMEILSTFDTDMDEIMGRYQPSIDSKTGMRAYEDELIAAMERNEQLRNLDKMVDYAFDPGSPSANFMQMFRQYQNDESYRAITDNWTEEDRYTLGLLQQEDPAKAREFAIERNNYYNAQATDPMRQQIREQAPGNILGNTGKALLAGMAGAGEIFDRLAETAARGQTTEKGYITPSDYAQETTGAISEYLNQKYGTVDTENFQNLRDIGQQGLRDANVDPTYIGGAGNGLLDLARDVVDNKGVGDLYNFGYSLAQNLTSRYTLGNIGGQPLVLANYFANAATSAIDDARRRGASGSQAMGIGLIKGALEVGTEFIPTSELFKMGPAVTVKDFLKSVGVEALEEFVGEGANALGGYIADKAIMGNLSEFETAKRKYMEDQGMTEEQAHAQAIKDAITNIVSEGISGALSGSISGGAESAFKTGLANQYYRNINPQTLIDEGMNTEQGSDAYRLAQQMQERVDNDQRVSGNQKRVLDYELRKLAAAKVAAETAAENQPAAQEQETKKPAEKPAVSKEGRSIQISTEAPIDINDFAEIKNGKATIQLKDGGTVGYSDVSFATEAEANQYYAVSTLPGIETEAANNLLHTIQEAGAGQDDQSIIAVREAYRLGYAGAQASELANSDAAALSPDLRQKVFEIGQSQRRADAMAKPTVREAATKPTDGYKKVVIEGKISKPNKKTQKKWDAEIAFMDYIADNFSGNAVHVYESYKGRDGKYYYRDSNGKVNRAPNGMYVNGEIWVDLRSGDNQEGLVLNTFAHEMYHHIERFDKAKAQELAEFVVKELGMESVDKAVEAQIKKARKAGLSETYFMNVKGMTAEQARNEVYMRAMSDFVADSLETMFTRGDPAKAIADLKKENRTLFDQIKAFIDKWVSKLKDFYKDKTVSEEGAVVAQLKNFEQLQQLFMEGVQSAGENYREALKEPQKGTRKEYVAQFSNRYADQITEQDRKYLDAVNRGDMETAQKMVDDAAKAAGYDSPKLYHGTNAFGFTEFITSMSDDRISIFTTSNSQVAETYSGETSRRRISDKAKITPEELENAAPEELLKLLRENISKDYRLVSEAERDQIIEANRAPLLQAARSVENLYVINMDMFDDKKKDALFAVSGALRDMSKADEYSVFMDKKMSYDDALWDLRWLDDSLTDEVISAIGRNENLAYRELTKWLGATMFHADAEYSRINGTPWMNSTEAVNELFPRLFKGVYELYGRTGNAFEMEADGANWNQLDGGKIGQYGPVKTRDVARYAKENGHDSAIFRNIKDNGDYTYGGTSDVYVFFGSDNLKSADPVTYDDDGNIIPISHRFNRENEDIRNSLRNQKATGRQIERLNDKLKTQKQESRDRLKNYKAEQKELIKAMQQEQRVIREELTGKASDVTLMEKEFIRLVKQYEKLDAKTGKKTIKDTKTIVDLKAALKAEARSHREDSKIWEREFNRLLRDYETAGRQIERLEATILRQRATAKARVEGRRKTEMRHKIQRKADELNRLLTHGTKHRNIPENLQPAVADILNAINMEVRDGEQRRKTYEATIARYDRQIAAETNPARVTDLINKRNEYAAKGDQFANNMAKLKEVYDQIRKDENSNVQIDDGLAGLLDTLFEKVGDTPLGQMTMDQLEAVNDVLNITRKTIVEANKLFQENQRQGVEETSKNAMREIRTVGGGAKKTIEIAEAVKKFGWNNLKPVYVFEAIGSKVMTGLFNNLRKGEDTLARDLQEGRTFFQNQWQKHKGENWDKEKKWAFTSTSGKRFELDLMQIMSLYALSKRDQARDHLRVGGFSFDSQYKVKDEIKIGPIKFKADVITTDASAYNLSDEILGEIIGKLTAEQRAFVDEMQSYLSDTMAAKGNEISMQKYGIRLFKEKNYFPLRVADQFMAKVREQNDENYRKLKDAGFTKETTPNAKNPVVLSSFLDVWAEHVDEMSLYHSFVLPLDDMSRVLNYHDAFVEENSAASVVEAIRTAYGEGATQYIDQLIRDINGGARADSMASTINKLISTAKKTQTMASLSVAIQQPSSILRACAEIDGKYFLGRRVTEKMHDTTWAEIKKHAPIAIIKEMGGFDTNVGKSTVEYLTDTANYEGFGEKFKALFTDRKFRDDTLGRLPALMDEMAWGAIWNAVKREQADKHPNMDVKSDAFMKIVADRFTDVIVKTQVYDSVFSRSGMMRSKDTGVKMTTAFMAEPTTTANMLAAAIFKAKRGEISKADAAKTVGAIVASLAANAALVSLVYAMRDDDEDKRYDEKYIKNLFSEFFDSLNPIGYIPILRDFQSMARGFDVERADMALFGDLLNAIQGLKDEKRTAWEKTEAVIGSVGNLFGVPLKNIIRDGKGAFKTITIALDKESKDRSTNTGYYMAVRQGVREGLPRMPWKKVTEPNDKDEMILAIQRGDEEHLQRVFGRFENQQKAESALQSAIGEYYKNGKLTAEEAEELLTTNFDRGDEHEVYWILDSWDYAKDNKTSEGYAKYGKFIEGVEDGDFQDEMDRLMEHGADASDIRSQITRKYRKQYLEDESAREGIRQKLQPVFEATGMDDDEIAEKFNDWDFETEYGMTYSAFKSEYKAGNVTEAEMRDAMDFYGKLNYEIDEEIRDLKDDVSFEKKFGMTLGEMKDAYDNGDVTRNTLISALQYSGMTKKEAQKTVNQRDIGNRIGIDYANLGDAYTHGDISRQTLYNALVQNGATKQEADEAIVGYDWLKKHVKKYPDLTISDAKKFAVRISDNQKEYTLTDYGVTIDSYIEYTKRRAECTGVDADGDGQIDSGTLRDEIFRMIDSLPISSEAKDGLAQIGYSIKSIRKNAPWH